MSNQQQAPSALTFADKTRREWYLFTLELHLAGMPDKKVKEIKQGLRGELTAAAQDVGMRGAIRQAGNVRVIAAEYLDAHGTKVPRVWAGSVALAVLLYGWLLAVISHLDGMINAVEQFDVVAPTTVTSTWLLSEFYVEVSDDGIEAFGLIGTTQTLVVTLSVFAGISLIVARIWRVWIR
jgi:hypothetical protein